ncbi:MAG: glycosyltransferase family 2 protein [Pseudomonadota bacterium]
MTPVLSESISVIIVTYNAESFVLDCIASVLASKDVDVRLVVVDNASTDGTRAVVREWANGARVYRPSSDLPLSVEAPDGSPDFELSAPGNAPEQGRLARLSLIEAPENGGFAAGVNIGIRFAVQDPKVSHFWVLNPDSVATPETAAAFLGTAAAEGGAGLLTGRSCYYHDPEMIQIDGGLINPWTGVTSNANVGEPAAETDMPDGKSVDFAFGGNMVVSREFIAECGEMPEEYFLYYEEVDWSLRRGRFPIVTCQDGLIYHRAGASIGSPIFGGRGATPFSLYFKQRARMMFMRRYFAARLPVAAAYTLAKAFQTAVGGNVAGAAAILRGGFGFRPPRAVEQRLRSTAVSDLVPAARP